MSPKELEHLSSITQLVSRGLDRAKAHGTPELPMASIKAGLNGSREEEDVLAAKRFLDLMNIMNPDNIDHETGEPLVEFQSDIQEVLGDRLNPMIQEAYSDFPGRGWSASDVEALRDDPSHYKKTPGSILQGIPGKSEFVGPGAREASPGDRWANESRSDYNFAKKLLEPEVEPTGNAFMDADLSGTGYTAPRKAEQYQYAKSREGDVYENEPRVEGGLNLPEIGEALFTPQDTAGSVVHAISAQPNSWLRHNITGRDETEHGPLNWEMFKDSLWNSDAESNREARDHVRAIEVSNRPSTLHNKDFDNWQDKEAHRRQVKGLRDATDALSYDDSYRQSHGQYPSYAASTAVGVGEELYDYGTPISLIAGGLPGLMAKNPALMVSGALGNAATEWSTEDVPMVAGIQAGSQAMNGFQNVPPISKWFDPNAREAYDLSPETDEEHAGRLDEHRGQKAGARKFLKGLTEN